MVVFGDQQRRLVLPPSLRVHESLSGFQFKQKYKQLIVLRPSSDSVTLIDFLLFSCRGESPVRLLGETYSYPSSCHFRQGLVNVKMQHSKTTTE